MNIEIKFQFTDIASAAAFLADAAGDPRVVSTATPVVEVNSAGTSAVSNPSPEVAATPTQEAPKAEGKRGPGRPPKAAVKEQESAAPVDVPSTVKTQEPVSTPATDIPVFVQPTKARTYEETDFADRIMKLVAEQKETGNKSKVEALKAALGALGMKSARDLKPEQLDAFGETLTGIEAMAAEEVLG